MLRYVIFDMDGVIIDSEPMHARAAVNALANFGITVDIPYCYQFIGSTTRFMMETIISDFHMNTSPEELLSAVEAEKVRLTLEEGYTEVPYVCALIRDLHQHGVKLAVASSSNPDEIEKAVTALSVKSCFDKLVSGCTVAHPKPAPDVFLKALDELGASKEECLIIEDSMNGLLAAKAAGIPAIGFDNPNSGAQDLSTAFLVVEGFDEIDYQFLSNAHSRFHHLPITIAETERLTIREMMPEDVSALFPIYQNEEIQKYNDPLNDSIEEEIEKQKAYIEHVYHFYGYGIWGVFEVSSGKLVGRCGIEYKCIEKTDVFELSYLFDRSFWGQGYAMECVNAVLSYAKEHLGIRTVTSVIDKQNLRSIRFAEKLGFIRKGEVCRQNRECVLYTLSIPEEKQMEKQKEAAARAKKKYQEHPDTSVYGKRYS